MKRQKGQTLVEFALVMPMIALFIFGMIYGALIFVDYMDFSNEARTIARQVAVMDEDDRTNAFTATPQKIRTFASFYNVTRKVSLVTNEGETKPADVLVEIDFTRNNEDLPNVLKWVGFPPETIRPIKYRMKLEYHINNNSTDTTNTETTE
jgi:Flp pilus assembly protein TadG